MDFHGVFHALGGSVGLLKRSKVQLPPTGGVGWTTRKRAKVHTHTLRGSDGLFKPCPKGPWGVEARNILYSGGGT